MVIDLLGANPDRFSFHWLVYCMTYCGGEEEVVDYHLTL